MSRTIQSLATEQSPISNLPKEWGWTKFGSHFTESDERNGKEPPGPLLSVSEFRGVEVNRRTDGQQPSLDVAHYRVVRPGQLAANMMWLNHGGLGVSDLVGYISPAYKAFWISSSFDSRYVHHLLRSSRYVDYFSAVGTGVRPNSQMVTKTVLDMMPIPLPPLETQRAIADYLDRETGEIDAMLGRLGELAETLGLRRVSVMQRETQYMKDGNRWGTVPTSHLFENIGSGTTPREQSHYTESSDGIPWVTTSELRETLIEETARRVTQEAVASVSSLKIHPKGSVLIAMYGATIGRLGVLGIDATVNQACCAFSEPLGVDTRFFYYTLWGQRDDIIRVAVGGGQPNISQTMLRRWRIPLPPLEEQRRIADHLDEVTGKIDAMLVKVAELKALLIERRAALITDVVTGRKDISNA